MADAYLRFWFHYVLPYQSFLQLGKRDETWEREIEPTLDQFVARTSWEEVCSQYLWRQLTANALPVRFAHLGRYWDGKEEIDLVGLWHDKATVIGECKWTAQPMDVNDLATLERKAAKLQISESPLWVLASRSGFTRRLLRRSEQGDLLLIEPARLFSSEHDPTVQDAE